MERLNWLLIGVLALILLCAWNGYRRGFIRLFVSFAFIILALFLVRMATPYCSSFLEKYTPVYSSVRDSCMEIFQEDAGEYDAQKKTDQVRAIENSRLPEGLKKALIENNHADIYDLFQVTGFDEYVGTYMAKTITNIIAFVLAFLLIYIVMKIILFSLDILSHLPILHGINKMAGLLLGLAQSVILVWIVFLIITVFASGETGRQLFGMINESRFLTFLYSNNYLLGIIGAIVVGL